MCQASTIFPLVFLVLNFEFAKFIIFYYTCQDCAWVNLAWTFVVETFISVTSLRKKMPGGPVYTRTRQYNGGIYTGNWEVKIKIDCTEGRAQHNTIHCVLYILRTCRVAWIILGVVLSCRLAFANSYNNRKISW